MQVSTLKILFKLTTRSRPANALRCLESLYANKSDNPSFNVCVTLDEDDPTVTHDFLEQLFSFDKCYFRKGISANKVAAFNRDVDGFIWDIIVCLSDDMVVVHKDFDEVIREQFCEKHPENCSVILNLDTLLHTPDGVNESLLTISIMGYDYYKRDGYIYHPSYIGLFCDNEAMIVGMRRDKLKFCKTQLIKHIHPNYGQAPRDMQYIMYDGTESQDRLNFQKREREGFAA